VKILIRGDDLKKSMSAYLCERVLKHPKIEVIKNSEVREIHGEKHVEAITYQDHTTGDLRRIDCGALFCFIGAQPHTSWLPKGVLLDEKGFIRTGSAIPATQLGAHWKLDRHPCDLETAIPGILAAGDVRSGSTKRCGFAVGDGSMAVACMHRYLATIGQ
jgi:thioredoxin reductase (NADPH)